jgi:hypothetical protein
VDALFAVRLEDDVRNFVAAAFSKTIAGGVNRASAEAVVPVLNVTLPKVPVAPCTSPTVLSGPVISASPACVRIFEPPMVGVPPPFGRTICCAVFPSTGLTLPVLSVGLLIVQFVSVLPRGCRP